MTNSYREISGQTARRIDRKMLEMAGIGTLRELEAKFIEEGGGILPADFLCWNNWSLDWQQLSSYHVLPAYEEICASFLDVFGEVFRYHPVIAVNQLPTSREQVLRLSDFQNYSSFVENPLFREVYRHLDAHFQISYTAGTLRDRHILLTWNRRALDFNRRDQEILHYLGKRLGILAHRVEEREHLDKAWETLCGFIDPKISAGSVVSLGERDGRLVALLLRSRSRDSIASGLDIRRDTVDKRLGAIRERLGLENHHQLLSALADLRNVAAD